MGIRKAFRSLGAGVKSVFSHKSHANKSGEGLKRTAGREDGFSSRAESSGEKDPRTLFQKSSSNESAKEGNVEENRYFVRDREEEERRYVNPNHSEADERCYFNNVYDDDRFYCC